MKKNSFFKKILLLLVLFNLSHLGAETLEDLEAIAAKATDLESFLSNQALVHEYMVASAGYHGFINNEGKVVEVFESFYRARIADLKKLATTEPLFAQEFWRKKSEAETP